MFRCDAPVEMKGKQLVELSTKGVHMRCDDTYGHRPERDGPILVGVFIGRQRLFLLSFSHFEAMTENIYDEMSFSGLMIGIPITLFVLYIYRRGCFGILGYRPNPADYGRAFYKRTELREDLHI